MKDDYPPLLVAPTPDDVLAIMRGDHRQQCLCDPEADPTIVLSRATTISQWRNACDLVDSRRLAVALNQGWSVDIPIAEWSAVLNPPQSHTLGEVCDLLSRYAKMPRARATKFFGHECVPAGVFLTVRHFLSAAGADGNEIWPSTPLAQYTRRYFRMFLGPVSLLAPGTLPVARIRVPHYHACLCICGACWLAGMIALLSGFEQVAIALFFFVALGWAATWIVARSVLPTRVESEGLHTFGDLSRLIAKGAEKRLAADCADLNG